MGWIAIEFFYRFIPNNYTEKQKQIIQNYDSEVLILGNSHSFYGINPSSFNQKAYNFSNISQSLYFDELLLEKNITHFNNLKYVILTIDYFTLSQEDDTSEDLWRKYYYQQYMNLEVPSISKFDFKSYSLAITRNLEMNIELLQKYRNDKKLVECDDFGWGRYEGVNLEYNNSVTAIDIVKKNEDGLTDFKSNELRLQRMIDLCNKDKIKLVLITMPVTSYYAKNVNENKLKKIVASCNYFEEKNKNVIYLNLFQSPQFDNNDFYDTDHLNTKGAEKCSKILNKLILDLK
ncbi:hypothetical protein D3C80_1288060 [compost metagenome]